MNKIKKFRIAPRPASVLKNLKALAGEAHATPELESALETEMRRAVDLFAPSALYDTFEPGRTPDRLGPLWAKPADAPGDPVALTLYAATIGTPLEEELGAALSRGEGLMSRVLTAVGEESAEQAAAFVSRLAAEEASREGCELSDRREASTDDVRRGVLSLLGAEKAGITVDAAGHLSPRFTRVGGILCTPEEKKINDAGKIPGVKDSFLSFLIAFFGVLYLRFVVLTSRFRVTRHPSADALLKDDRPCIFAFWHRYQLMMAWEHRNRGVNVLVSRSKDGDLIAGALHRLGYRTARGSTSRGGAAAMLELVGALTAGGQAAVTPDGPRGPCRSLQPGLTALARMSGVPVVPCGWAGTRVKALTSWDRFMIPLPFGRYEVVFGEPLFIGRDENADDRLRAALDAAPAEAKTRLERKSP